MPFTTISTERLRFREFALFCFIGIAVGLVFSISIGLSKIWSILFIVAIVSVFVAILSGSPKRFLLALLILCIPINVDRSFFLHPGHTGGAVGLSISIWEISLYLLIAIWVSEVVSKKDQEISFLAKWSMPIFCLLGLSLLSTTKSSDIGLSAFEIIQLVKVYLLFFYVANCIKTKEEFRYVLLLLALTFLLEIALGLFQYSSGRTFDLAILGGDEEKFAARFGAGTFLRVPGTFASSNGFAKYLIMVLPLLLCLLFFSDKRAYKLLFGSLFIMGVVVLILTLSRGAWVGFGTSVAVVFFIICRISGIRFKTVFLGLVLLLTLGILLFNFREAILLRFYGDDYGSALSRISMMRIAFEMIKANPFLGVGINNYCEVMARYDITGLVYGYFQPVHNVYLQIAAEIGIFGLSTFLWFIFLLYREGLRNLKTLDGFVSGIRIGLIGGITGLLVQSMVDNGSLGDEVFIFFWFLAGLLVASTRITSEVDE